MDASNGNVAQNQWRAKVGLPKCSRGASSWTSPLPSKPGSPKRPARCAVMAFERVPADIRNQGGVARMASPRVIREIMDTVTIPVMAKARIGHFVEAQVLEALEMDFIDECEVLTPA